MRRTRSPSPDVQPSNRTVLLRETASAERGPGFNDLPVDLVKQIVFLVNMLDEPHLFARGGPSNHGILDAGQDLHRLSFNRRMRDLLKGPQTSASLAWLHRLHTVSNSLGIVSNAGDRISDRAVLSRLDLLLNGNAQARDAHALEPIDRAPIRTQQLLAMVANSEVAEALPAVYQRLMALPVDEHPELALANLPRHMLMLLAIDLSNASWGGFPRHFIDKALAQASTLDPVLAAQVCCDVGCLALQDPQTVSRVADRLTALGDAAAPPAVQWNAVLTLHHGVELLSQDPGADVGAVFTPDGLAHLQALLPAANDGQWSCAGVRVLMELCRLHACMPGGSPWGAAWDRAHLVDHLAHLITHLCHLNDPGDTFVSLPLLTQMPPDVLGSACERLGARYQDKLLLGQADLDLDRQRALLTAVAADPNRVDYVRLQARQRLDALLPEPAVENG